MYLYDPPFFFIINNIELHKQQILLGGRMEPQTNESLQGKYKFIEWMDLENNGVVGECAILKKFANGDVYFFPLASLDNIDKHRLRNILTHKSAGLYTELWSMLEHQTLGNGMNALLYFNQLAKLRTASGQILPFGTGKQSAPTRLQNPIPTESQSFEALAKTTKATAAKTA